MNNDLISQANELMQKGDIPGAIGCFQRLTELVPEDRSYINSLSRLYELNRQYDKAYDTFLKIWNNKTGKLTDETHASPLEFARAGEYAYHARLLEPAIQNLEKSLDLEPDNPGNWCFLGRCHSSAGNSADAQVAFEKAIKINPRHFPAYYYLSRISGFAKGDPAFARLESFKTDQAIPKPVIADLGFALGRMYQSAKDYDKAFDNFSYGNAAARQHSLSLGYTFDHENHRTMIDLISALYSRDNRKKIQISGSDSQKPVFIVGMQRTGSTLLEQILSAHNQISSAGELVQLAANHQELLAWVAKFKEQDQIPAFVKALDQKAGGGRQMVKMFLETLESKGEKTPLIIDKLPQNYLQLGFIEVLFPKAKIIHIKRDPLDVGLSVFSSQFSSDLSFAQDLGDIGFYIKEQNRLMAFWKASLDIPVHEVTYETLVTDPETTIRGILEFCEVEWQTDCLEFYKNPGKVFTSSVMQVRNPINKSAIGNWKRYEKHLGPLKAALEG